MKSYLEQSYKFGTAHADIDNKHCVHFGVFLSCRGCSHGCRSLRGCGCGCGYEHPYATAGQTDSAAAAVALAVVAAAATAGQTDSVAAAVELAVVVAVAAVALHHRCPTPTRVDPAM